MRIFGYLFKEIMLSFVAVCSVVLLIFISTRFVKYLARAAEGSLSSDILFQVMLYRLPGFVELILPLSLFIGIMLACGRLYIDSEMIVLQACGLSKRRLLAYIQGPALFVAAMVALLSLWISPLGLQKFYVIWNNPETFSGMSTLVAGEFKEIGSDTMLYTGQLNQDKTELSDVFIVRRISDKQLSIVRGDRAKMVNYSPTERYVELSDGVQYEGVLGRQDYSVSYFKHYSELFQLTSADMFDFGGVEAESTQALWQSDKLEAKSLLQWRISLIFIAPIAAILALALSETNHRRGRYAKLLPGLVLYMLYFGALISLRSQIDKGNMPLFSLWLVHAGFLLIALMAMFPPQLSRKLKPLKAAA